MKHYTLAQLLAGLRAMAHRAEARQEDVSISPSKLIDALDAVEPLLPKATETVKMTDGRTFTMSEATRYGILKDLSLDNRDAARQRLKLSMGVPVQKRHFFDESGKPFPVDDAYLDAIVDAVEADAQEGTQNAT